MDEESLDEAGTAGAMFGPLTFPSSSKSLSDTVQSDWDTDEEVPCVLCDTNFTIPRDSTDLFTHLFKEHRLVIGDSDRVASLKSYLRYWRVRLAAHSVERFCFTLTMDVTPDGTPSPGETYFLLADNLDEDRQLREGLQLKRLERVLAVQERERVDAGWSRGCLFCRREVRGRRAAYLEHLAERHNLQLGRPDNLVFVDKLLDAIQAKIDGLECLFCGKLFKDRNVLKEHMRKKQHKRINPDNAAYDKYFAVNYLEMGKSWQQVQNEPDDPDPVPAPGSAAADWDDWESEEPEDPVVCLFCPWSDLSFDAVASHMADEHAFDYRLVCASLGLDFYQQVKLVNWIRRQVHCRTCLGCDSTWPSAALLLAHMREAGHLAPPPAVKWNQPEYFFPTFENDSFLCHLEDDADSDPIPEMEDMSLDPDANRKT